MRRELRAAVRCLGDGRQRRVDGLPHLAEAADAFAAARAIQGEHGYGLKVTKTIREVDPDRYDLLVVPGGSPDGAPATVRGIKPAQDIARSFFARNKPVASICHGPWLLVSADVVRGRRLTSYWHDGVPEDIKAAGGIYEDEEVVVDGNLVTSRWPLDLPAFVREMMKLLQA